MTSGGIRAPRALVGDPAQIASVRRVVLDDGPERGLRALIFSTGGGLDFWVLSDRSLDIGLLSWKGRQIAWQSPGALRAPALLSPDSDSGFGFNRGFGGFLVTCGLDHIRQPDKGLPLHGHLPYTPARLLASGEDWSAAEPLLFCEGEITQWRHDGEAFRLRRRIEAPIGGAHLRIRDRIENIGPEPLAPALLYHFNLGFPAVAPGTVVQLDGRTVLGPLAMPEEGPPGPSALHPSSHGDVSECVVEGSGYRVVFRYSALTLPYLQLWRDLRPRCGVLSIEPCALGKRWDGTNEPGPMLKPGDSRSFNVEISIEA